jgi:hypothetical protein
VVAGRVVEHPLDGVNGEDGTGLGREPFTGVVVHVRGQSVEKADGVVDDRRVVLVDAVQQPARQLQFAVEQGALGEVLVGTAVAPREVCLQCGLGGGAARGQQPMEVARRVADREGGPPDDRRHGGALHEDGVRGERAVDDGRPESPERLIVGGLLPAPEDRGRQAARVRGASDEVDDGVVRLVGGLAWQAGIADESARQCVDRGDRGTDPGGERLVLGELVGRADGSGHVFRDDGPRAVDRRLTEEGGHPERETGADAGSHRADRDEVRRLLRLRVLRARSADHETPSVDRFERHRIVAAVAPTGVRPGGSHLESGHRRRGQRG